MQTVGDSVYPKAIYTHCYGHALNLAAGDAIKHCKIMKDALDIIFEVSKLIKYSSKRDVQFESLKQNLAPDTPGFHVLCPTRWTVHANSLKSVTDNYTVLQNLWETSKDETSDTSIKARTIGVATQFKMYAFFFGVHLGYLILKHTDSLSQTLQFPKLFASEGQRIASMTVTTMETLRNETNFKLFWQKINHLQASFDIEETKLPRKRRVPTRFEEGTAEGTFFDECESYFCSIYYEALDLIINCIKERFDQPGFGIYKNLQGILIKSVRKESYDDSFNVVTLLYQSDINPDQLRVHLETLSANFPPENRDSITIFDVKDYVLSLFSNERLIMSEVCVLLKLILVMPSTNAVNERSFSALRRIKTYLQSTMLQEG